jgi:hypothetical protein
MDYKDLLAKLEARFAELRRQRVEIDREMMGLVKTIEGLKVLAQKPPPPTISPPPPPPISESTGFTEKVRGILKSNENRKLSPTEIRDALVSSGGEEDSKTVLIQVHNTLKRLIDQNEVFETQTNEGKLYSWKSEFARLAGLMGIGVQSEGSK